MLQTKIPPPIVALVFAVAMWGLSFLPPVIAIDSSVRNFLIILFIVLAIIFDLAALFYFLKAKTTINPLQPKKASKLVINGIYRISRNPMYVGLTFLLMAWGVFISSPWAIIGIIFFVMYITIYQIKPEEYALKKTFGVEFDTYKKQVRMWL